MTEHAVIQGRYADLKFIRTRSVCQIVIEVPIEEGGRVMEALGPPLPSAEVPVAIARLDPTAKAKPAPRKDNGAPSRRWSELTCAQQAGIRCGEPAFSRFLEEMLEHQWSISEGDPAEVVRDVCNVDSRAQLDDVPEAGQCWRNLDDEFQAWLRVG